MNIFSPPYWLMTEIFIYGGNMLICNITHVARKNRSFVSLFSLYGKGLMLWSRASIGRRQCREACTTGHHRPNNRKTTRTSRRNRVIRYIDRRSTNKRRCITMKLYFQITSNRLLAILALKFMSPRMLNLNVRYVILQETYFYRNNCSSPPRRSKGQRV